MLISITEKKKTLHSKSNIFTANMLTSLDFSTTYFPKHAKMKFN